MIPVSREERHWFLKNVARALMEFSGVSEPPVPVEDVLNHPPTAYQEDFGVVDMYSNLWDATFARPPGQRGSIFVRVDLEPEDRRFALARETLCAMITSKHGRDLGLPDLLMSELRDSAEYFAAHYLAPDALVRAYRAQGGDEENFSGSFELPSAAASARW
ncbi:MAG: hypothetical protein ACE5JF_06465 [Anaerolineales bacterium]